MGCAVTDQLLGNSSPPAKRDGDLFGRPEAALELLEKGSRVVIGGDLDLDVTHDAPCTRYVHEVGGIGVFF